jgi:hypothetical protein
MMSEPIRTPVGMMWVDETGLLWHRLDDGVTVRVEHAAGIRRAVQEVSNSAPVRAVVDVSGVQFADRDARDAIASSLDDSNEVATAVIVGSAISRALGTLFLKLSRPARPVRLFLDENDAANWARGVPAPD